MDWLCIVEIFPSIVKVLTLENIILLNPFIIFLEQLNITQTKVKQKKYAQENQIKSLANQRLKLRP